VATTLYVVGDGFYFSFDDIYFTCNVLSQKTFINQLSGKKDISYNKNRYTSSNHEQIVADFVKITKLHL